MTSRASRLTEELSRELIARGWRMATAESCTGGLIAKTLTDLAGSSDWFDRGFVTYSNQAKIDMLGVSPDTLERHGAVSELAAREMVLGALKHSEAQLAVSVTGIAGPGGGSAEKPVGTVWFGFGLPNKVETNGKLFEGTRESVRQQSLEFALGHLIQFLD